MKTCSRCGLEKPLVDFRTYYNRNSTYKYCKSCERIETRYKYLRRLGDAASPKQKAELEKINLLYDLAKKRGLDAPGRSSRSREVDQLVDTQLAKLMEATQ